MDETTAYTSEDISEVLSRMEEISALLAEEDGKPDSEYDKEKAVKLAYAQMFQGMKILPGTMWRPY